MIQSWVRGRVLTPLWVADGVYRGTTLDPRESGTELLPRYGGRTENSPFYNDVKPATLNSLFDSPGGRREPHGDVYDRPGPLLDPG